MEKFRAVSISPFFDTPDGPTPQAFISYSHRDLDFVKKLVQDGKHDGMYIWLDQVDMPDYFYKFRVNEANIQSVQMRNAELSQNLGWGLYRSEFFIIVLTPHSIKSKWVGLELNMAQHMGKIIVPILKIACTIPLNEKEVVQLPVSLIHEGSSMKDSDKERWFKLASHILAEQSYAKRRDITSGEEFAVIPEGYIDFIDDTKYFFSKDFLIRYMKYILGYV